MRWLLVAAMLLALTIAGCKTNDGSDFDYEQRCREWTEALIALNKIVKDEDGFVNPEIQESIDEYLKLIRDFACPAIPIIIDIEEQQAARKTQ